MPAGRFAPSPTGDLHLGNLRTALVAWLFARSTASGFVVRMDDLDEVVARPEHEHRQLDDLRAIGLDWDGPVVRQSARRARYDEAIATLTGAGRTYECFCTRREIREAASAPNGPAPEGAYPGTCRALTTAEREERRRAGRPPAIRFRAEDGEIGFVDRLAGPFSGVVDDVVLRRNDGTPAYNLAVVLDDADQGVAEVVRGDDLLSSTPRQIVLATTLALPSVTYAHVPLVLGPDGARLAKRHGAVSLADLAMAGHHPYQVVGWLAASLGLAEPGEGIAAPAVLERFERLGPDLGPRWPTGPWQLDPDALSGDETRGVDGR